MKKNLLFFLCVLATMTCYAQQTDYGNSLSLGTVSHLLKTLERACTGTYFPGNIKPYSSLMLTVPDGRDLPAKVYYYQNPVDGCYSLQGEISGVPGQTFCIEINGRELKGHIIMKEAKKAYAYFSDAQGNAFIEETNINNLLCIDFPVLKESAIERNLQLKPTIDPAVAGLESFPGATGCLLLDFDGYEMPAGNLWNSGNAISADSSGMTNADITTAWQIVSEDYAPFNINVTTSEAVYNTYPQNKRMRCVITPTDYFAPGIGGVAYLGSFTWSSDVPCWAFTTGVGTGGKNVGEVASHELGHTFNLGHDGTASQEYYGGQGNWAPIMGVGYYENVTQWSKGEYTGANNQQDDLAIIANVTNDVGYRTDDHTNLNTTATVLNQTGGIVSAAQNKGIIGTTGDIDRFRFAHAGGSLNFNIEATLNNNSNVRLQAVLYNSLGVPVNTYTADAANLSSPVAIAETVPADTYYLTITGTSEGIATTTGYSNYASLGVYSISGMFNPVPLPVTMSPLNGRITEGSKSFLYWKTFSEHNNTGFFIERSQDGRDFFKINFVPSAVPDGNSEEELRYEFTDEKSIQGTSYYRIVQQDKDGKTTNSNIVKLELHHNTPGLTVFPNPANTQLNILLNRVVTADARITIADVAGRQLWNQPVRSAQMHIDISSFQQGVYLLKYTDHQNSLSYRFIKK